MERTVSITFGRNSTDKSYSYKLAPGLTVIEGDKVVAQVGDNESCMVGIVTEVHAAPHAEATKWVFQRVDNELNKSLPRA